MPTYHLAAPAIPVPGISRFKALLAKASLTSVGFFLLDRLWGPHRSLDNSAWSAIVFGIMTAGSQAWRSRKAPPIELVVADEEIRGVPEAIGRSIHKGQIRTVVERRYGLLVSDHGCIHLFFWGGIWIPKSLPQFEELRKLVESWRRPASDR